VGCGRCAGETGAEKEKDGTEDHFKQKKRLRDAKTKVTTRAIKPRRRQYQKGNSKDVSATEVGSRLGFGGV